MRRRSGLRDGFVVLAFVVGCGGVLGCGDFLAPTGRYAITHPWDAGPPISRGTSKAEVLAKWGPPDAVIPLGLDELGIFKEEWIYQARADVPIDIRYLSKTKRILFAGDFVTGWKDEAAQDGPTHR